MKKQTKIYQGKSISELEKEAHVVRTEIAKMSLEKKASQPKDTNTVFKKRKQLAVLLTVMHQKKELEQLKK